MKPTETLPSSFAAFEWQQDSFELHPSHLRFGNAVVIADLHLGKTMHFRKAGIPIPAAAKDADQRALMHLLHHEQPDRLIVLGDLFHSASNAECEELAMITSQFPSTSFELVLGNHDILDASDYRSMDFQTCDALALGSLFLTHEPQPEDQIPDGKLNLHGHLHPGIRLMGRGRQSIMVPCYYQTKSHLCMPAFGALTGLMRMKPKSGDRVFGVIEGEVKRVF